MIVSQILKSKPHQSITTVKPSSKINEAAQILSKHRIGALIVSETGSDVAGILSERDIVRAIGATGVGCLDDEVQELMTRKVTTCAPGDTAVSILGMMTSGRFRHMPVMENDALIGVISIGDVVKARIDEVEHENSALTDMISGNT